MPAAHRVLAHERQGDGPVAVALLHGVGGSRHIWSDEVSGTARALAQAGFTALALDLPGYGESPLPAGLSIASMAQAVADTLQTLGFEQAVLLGHSMGGMVAQEFAATWPERVRALVLACTSPAFGRPGGDWQQAFLRDRLAPLDAGQGMAAVAERLVPAMVAPGVPETQPGASCLPWHRPPTGRRWGPWCISTVAQHCQRCTCPPCAWPPRTTAPPRRR